MLHRTISAEFTRIFFDRQARERRKVRGQRRGRIDPARVSRVATGNTRVFQQRGNQAGEGTAGSLAICCALQDLNSWHGHNGPQAKTWENTITALFLAAKETGINVRIFAGNQRRRGGPEVETFDSLEAFFAHEGENSWTRQRETVQQASDWHDATNTGGLRLTLLVTQWPEMRDPYSNQCSKRYKEFLTETGRLTSSWTRKEKFFALGCMLGETAFQTWGEYKKYGVDNHFRECFPSAMRYSIESPDGIATQIRSMSQRMARA